MKKLIFILIISFEFVFAHTRELQVQVVSSGSPIAKTVELYKSDAGIFKLYRSGSSTSYWKWTGPNANVACDIDDNNTTNPTWDPIEAGSYYIKIDNKYASLYINPNWQGSIDFLMKYENGTFTMEDGNPYVDLGGTQTWNKVTAEFKQFKSDGSTPVGTVAMGQGSSFSQRYAAPSDFYIDKNEAFLFHADTNINSSQKYMAWQDISDVKNFREKNSGTTNFEIRSNFNSTYSGVAIKNYLMEDGSTSGNTKFQDPWLIDYKDPSHGDHRRNRGTSALFISRTSPFSPNYSTNFGGNTYKGVFLNQTVSSGNYYSIQAPLTQTINGVTSYFQNWSTTGATLQQVGSNPSGYDQKAVVFTSSSAVVTANYKGHLYTNSSTATTTNSQRKIIQNSSGDWAMVYTSLNEVWLSRSTDGTNWDEEVKISDDGYTDDYPSIAIDGNTAYIVWQAIDWAGGTGFDFGAIYMRSYNLSTGSLGTRVEVTTFTPNIEAFQANPVIDVGVTNDEKMIAWRESNGLKVRYYDNYDGWSNVTSVTGTNSNSYNPSIADYNGYVYVLCWEDNANHEIKFTKATYSQTISFSTVEEVSPSNWESNGRPQGYWS